MRVSVRQVRPALAAVGLVIVGLVGWQLVANDPGRRAAAASRDSAAVVVSARLTGSTLAATTAVADSFASGVHAVHVRIVRDLALEIRITAPQRVVLAAPPRVCLVGPYSAPDDAGLSDRCWGDPDLATLLAAALPIDAAGHTVLEAGQAALVTATLGRGDLRCDYPPGDWTLEATLSPFVDGAVVADVQLPAAQLTVPVSPSGALPLVPIDQARYCGLAATVVAQQGEPAITAP